MVEVNGNDVNREYFPRTDDFSQEFADLEDALLYANGEDDSYFAQSTVPGEASYWPGERPPESPTIFEFGPAVHRKAKRSLRGVMIEPLDADFADMRGTERTEK
jgi:hypothetical protein